jgi:DNA-binding response OmpR family regulator/predicted regulator of Ras-like GTPase activity (Roadblock/LC7/MglB family)
MLKVLLIDDEPQLLRNVASFLSSFGDEFQPLTAPTGEEGLAILAAEGDIDILLTDVRLPGIDGIDVVRATVESFPETTIVVMTAFASSDIRVVAKHAGAIGFVEKPVDLDDLAVALYESHLRRQGASHEVSGLSVLDVARFLTVTGESKVVRFRRGMKEGTIAFEKGRMFYCSTSDREGNDAFLTMTLWGEGSFREDFDAELLALPTNIDSSAGEILEEASRLVDATQTAGRNSVAVLEAEAATEEAENRNPTIGEEAYLMAIKDFLSEFEDVEGFQGVAVFTAQGEMLDGIAKGKTDIKTVGMFANNALLNAQKATDQMGVGRGNFMQIRAPQATVLMRCLNEATDFAATKEGKAHFHTVVVMDPEGNAGMASVLLEKAVSKIADDLR